MPEYTPLKGYRLIGDLRTAALVNDNARIDWLCLPDFDSDGVFNRLLDTSGGHFAVESENYSAKSAYIKDTAIVKTTFTNNNHEFAVRDFMIPQPPTEIESNFLVRKLQAKSGRGTITLSYSPRPQYGQIAPDCEHDTTNNQLTFHLENGTVILHLPKNTAVKVSDEGCYTITTELPANSTKSFVLEYSPGPSRSEMDVIENPETKTREFWQNWATQANTFAFCRQQMKRSAITLKLLQHNKTGALIAAPTTSLPEVIGGSRNWDYRYAWIRDATFTLYSLLTLGLKRETKRFLSYISDILISQEEKERIEDLTHFYTIHGDNVQAEYSLEHLDGYKNSRPVRVGNSASKQFQLDTYGVMIDAYYLAQREGLTLSSKHKRIILKLVDTIASRWQEKDNGIWEVRGEKQHYTYSKVMCWVGIDRALRMRNMLGVGKDKVDKLKTLRSDIDSWIWKNCFNKTQNKLTQHPDTDAQDATNFLFPLVQFLDKDDRLTSQIIQNTQDELCFNGKFVYRYRNDDGLNGDEGAFVLCSYWLISALAKIGKANQAKRLFRRFESAFANSDLLPEEINPKNNTHLGNYPQAFSHMGYIMSAYYIQKYSPDDSK